MISIYLKYVLGPLVVAEVLSQLTGNGNVLMILAVLVAAFAGYKTMALPEGSWGKVSLQSLLSGVTLVLIDILIIALRGQYNFEVHFVSIIILPAVVSLVETLVGGLVGGFIGKMKKK